jgi:hypothetical protein
MRFGRSGPSHRDAVEGRQRCARPTVTERLVRAPCHLIATTDGFGASIAVCYRPTLLVDVI